MSDSNTSNETKHIDDAFPNETSPWVILICVISAVSFCVVISFIPFLFGYTFPTEANSFGDSFGFGNAVVSSMAFAALIATMFWQREELKQQRYEIRQMRLAGEASAEAQSKSHIALETAARLAALESLREAAVSMSHYDNATASSKIRAMVMQQIIEHALFQRLIEIGELRNQETPACSLVSEIIEMIDEVELYCDRENDEMFEGNDHLSEKQVVAYGHGLRPKIAYFMGQGEKLGVSLYTINQVRSSYQNMEMPEWDGVNIGLQCLAERLEMLAIEIVMISRTSMKF